MSSGPYVWKERPLAAGIQIAVADFMAVHTACGTIGCFVRQRPKSGIAAADNPPYLLTAGHVLMPQKKGGITPVDQRVYQPAPVGWINGVASTSEVHYEGSIDAGIALLDSDTGFRNYVWKIGDIKGIADPVDGMIVSKHGRTTGRTVGLVTMSSYTYGGFHDLFQITFNADDPANNSSRFGSEGDSGAPIMTGDGLLVGILHAVDEDGSGGYACKISNIFDAMRLSLA
ncbi:hypothetical protein RAH32_17740 [Paracoccus sp. WLY502]|uniref:hypothetical protein n=1 Tax=Paracoccus yibinensis TaxID=3068891 RepID=UPI002796A0BF|nr:hypothetical protein [Paracoccus sp. WLY502]MDQ1902267.1 hypothetical protein [Paracoccus sp. WLY502]